MTLTIGGYDHTSSLREGSLVIRHYGSLRSSFAATLFFESIPRNIPEVGEEILVQENGITVWGGILIEINAECHSPEIATFTLRGQGYEQILQRYCFPGIELGEMTPTEAATHIFNHYINPADGLTLGRISPGLNKKNEYVFYPGKASSVFNFLAAENGFHWWVDKTKTFYMQAHLPSTERSVDIDLTGKKNSRLKDIQTFVYRASTAEYKNIQYAFNKASHIEGNYHNIEGISQMANRYGGGEYGASASSSIIYSIGDAQEVAQQLLAGSPGTGEIEFTTDSDLFVPGQLISVTAPICGIETEQLFCVAEIRSVYFYNRFRYTVTAKETYSGSLSATSWESILAGGSYY